MKISVIVAPQSKSERVKNEKYLFLMAHINNLIATANYQIPSKNLLLCPIYYMHMLVGIKDPYKVSNPQLYSNTQIMGDILCSL